MKCIAPLFRIAALAAAVPAIFLATGCQSSDLSKDADIRREVVICLPPDTPAPSVVVRAVWFPNTNGFESADSSPVHSTGVLALADNKLWFMAWNNPERHYDMLHVIEFLTAERISVSHLGTSAMLVIQSSNDSYDSFELMNGGQFGSDPKVTQELLENLKARRAKSPQQDN
jgi:hypothetical protein